MQTPSALSSASSHGGLRCFGSGPLRLSLFDHKLEEKKKKARGPKPASLDKLRLFFFPLVFVGADALLKGRPPPLPRFPTAGVMGARPLMNPDSQQKADWGSALSSPGVGLHWEEVQLRVSPAMCHSSRVLRVSTAEAGKERGGGGEVSSFMATEGL